MCAHSPEEPGDKPRSNSLARTRQGGVAKTLECRVSGSVDSCCGALSGGWKAVGHMARVSMECLRCDDAGCDDGGTHCELPSRGGEEV